MEELHRRRVQYRYFQFCSADKVLRKEIPLHGEIRYKDGVFGERSFDSYEIER